MFEVDVGQGLKRQIPIIFPDSLIHKDMAEATEPIVRRCCNSNVKLISAGNISSVTQEVSGKSTTLNIESNSEDSSTISMYDYYHGIK
jgi:hypothetical protein